MTVEPDAQPDSGSPTPLSGSLITDLEWQAAAYRSLMANVADAMVNHESWTEVGRKCADDTIDWTYNHQVPHGGVVWSCIYLANVMIRSRDAFGGNAPDVARAISMLAASETAVGAAQRSAPQNPSVALETMMHAAYRHMGYSDAEIAAKGGAVAKYQLGHIPFGIEALKAGLAAIARDLGRQT